MPYADLHIHTYYSDGTMSPEEITEAALKNGVKLIAITDHNILEGSRKTVSLCKSLGIGCIPAVELNALDGKNSIHILGYGVDLDDPGFIAFTSSNRRLLDMRSDTLIAAMERDFPSISFTEYEGFTHDGRTGGWKALQYLLAKGVTASLKDGIDFYERYGVTHEAAGFPSVDFVARQVNKAGGLAILAHPGESFKSADIAKFRKEIFRLLDYGVEGIECYYPTHGEAVTKACLDICAEKKLLVTTGSDCHGAFGKTSVGETRISIEKLNLGDLSCYSLKDGIF